MRREGRILILVLCLLALTAGGVHVVAQEKPTDAETKRPSDEARLKAQRPVEAEQMKARAEQLKARRRVEAEQRKAKRETAMGQLKAKRAIEAEQFKVKRAIMVEQLKAKRAIEAKRREAPPEGTFKLLGPSFNLDRLVKGASRLNLNRLVKGAPYTATAITESIQTLADGNQIIQRNEAAYYRDSEGRTRMEQTLKKIGKWVAVGDPKRIIMIADPVAGHYYSLDANEHKAIKSPLFNKVASPASLQEEAQRQKQASERQRQVFEEQSARQRQRFEERWETRGRALKEQRAKPGQSQEEWARQKQIFEEQRAKEKQTFDEQRGKQKQRFEQELVERKRRFEEQLRRRQGLDGSFPKPSTEESQPKPKRSSSSEEKLTTKPPDSVNRKKTETLGKRVVEGVEAEGTRTTVTIPAGEIGNTLPIYIVDERWYSRDLQVPVMTRHHDPRSGDDVFRLTNINRSEPARSLFEVPPDYTVVEKPRPRVGASPGRPKIDIKRANPDIPKPQPNRLEPVKPAAPQSQ